jgi:hypothetical protein
MKQLIYSLLLVSLIHPFSSTAQVTTPQLKAGFGVDAELRANFYNGFLQSGNDDWFSNTTGATGIGVIDTTGAAYTVSRYTSLPATRSMPLFRGMAYPPFSIVKNRMLIDAVFIRDHHGDDSSVFASGSNKNGMNPNSWSTPISQGIPDKNDILDMFMHVRREGVNTNDSLWFFGGLSLDNTTGDRYFDFEMYQTDIYYDKPTLKFYGFGPDEGHTSWVFDASGNVVRAGDIIFTAEYDRDGLSLLEARIWINKSDLSKTPSAFSWGGKFDGDGTGALFGYASIQPKTAGNFYSGLQCGNSTWTGAFQCVLQNNTIISNYSAKQFVEFSVNLSKLGLDPLVTLGDACALPFRRLMVKSRASSSFTAELKDFVCPFSIFRAPAAQAASNFPVMCPNTISNIWVSNPLETSTYTWKAITGNIVGDTIGTSITVDQPGLYVVSQQLMDSCGTVYARDTMEVTLASNCQVLDQVFRSFMVKKESRQAIVSWYTDQIPGNNQFEVQRSTDGIHYQTIQTVAARNIGQYRVPDDISQVQSKWVYYRLRYVPSGQASLFSKSLSLFNKESNVLSLFTAPNPVTESLRIAVSLEQASKVEFVLRNEVGAVIYREDLNGNTGSNEWRIPRSSAWKAGMYILELKTEQEILRRRFLIQ